MFLFLKPFHASEHQYFIMKIRRIDQQSHSKVFTALYWAKEYFHKVKALSTLLSFWLHVTYKHFKGLLTVSCCLIEQVILS